MIYLDNAATSFIKPTCVQQAVHCALNTMSSPGRGAYSQAMKAAETLFKCRQAAAELFGVDEAERIVFTSNASHGLNIAINSLVKKNSRVLMSGYEHNSVSRPLYSSGARIKIFGRKLFEKQNALDDICEEINSADVVVCTHVSNVFGTVLPVEKLSALCKAKGLLFILDGAQSAGEHVFGKSITDPCLGWEKTERLILDLAEKL